MFMLERLLLILFTSISDDIIYVMFRLMLCCYRQCGSNSAILNVLLRLLNSSYNICIIKTKKSDAKLRQKQQIPTFLIVIVEKNFVCPSRHFKVSKLSLTGSFRSYIHCQWYSQWYWIQSRAFPLTLSSGSDNISLCLINEGRQFLEFLLGFQNS